MKCHLKSYVVPRSWTLCKKERVFAVRPLPGAHPADFSVPIAQMLRVLGLASTLREIKFIVNSRVLILNGETVRNHKSSVGFMDVMSIPALKKNYRVLVGEKGRLFFLEIPDSEIGKKIARVEGKTVVKGGKVQLNFSDGRNLLSDVDCAVGDSVVLEIPVQNVVSVLKLEKGAAVMLVKGKNTGRLGTVGDMRDNRLWFDVGGESFETLKEYAFVVGKEKPVVKVQ